jgi:membrane protease subunit HflK
MLYYRVHEPETFRFAVSDPVQIIREALAASIVEVLSRRYVDMILTAERAKCQSAIFERLKRTLREYEIGVELVDYRLLDIHAPIEVHPKFREVASAAEQMQSFILAATAERVLTLADAEVFAIMERNRALGEKETRVRQSAGYQKNFRLRADVYREKPRATREQLSRDLAVQTLPGVRTIVVPVPPDELNASTWLLPPTLFRPPEGETAP